MIDLTAPFITIGNRTLLVSDAIVAAGLLCIALVLTILIILWRADRANRLQLAMERQLSDQRAREAETRLNDVLQAQSELSGRLAAMQESVASQQTSISTQLEERLNNVSGRVSQSLNEQARSTHEGLSKLQERLAVIDTAQNNIQSLAKDVVGLQAILQNKQTRGAFGQSRMEAIVQDGLPIGAFEFQPTLSNGKRPDCTIAMPNNQPSLVIDAKFPLEGWNAMKAAEEPLLHKQAAQSFRRDFEVHIKDISEKYLLKGETQDTAFLFIPSESIFAEIHENFEGLVQRAHKARIVIVSPSLLLLSIQVIQAVLKDARMREQAHLIQHEVVRLMEDLGRLDDRVRKLQNHFNMTSKDIDQILTSTDKLTKRGRKIEELDFEPGQQTESQEPIKQPAGKPFLRAIEAGD